jgi:hypothetical protein
MTLFPRTPCLAGDDLEAKRREIRAYFYATFDRYEQLFEVLTGDEAYFEEADPAAPSADLLLRPHRHLLHQQAAAGRADPASAWTRAWNRCSPSASTR